MVEQQRNLFIPLAAMIMLVGVTFPMSTVQARSLGFSGGFLRGGGGGHHSGHFAHRPSHSHGSFGHHRSHRHGHFGYHRIPPYGHSGHRRPHRSYGHFRQYGYGRHYPRRYRYYSFGPVYGYGPSYFTGAYPYAYRRSYSLPATIANYPVVEDVPRQNPWILLAQGDVQSARRLFAHEAESFPTRGIPKLGYALSSALDGDLERAKWAMRRAFRAEPEALASFPLDPLLKTRLDSVGSYYEDSLESGAEPDAPFMLAALHFIDRDLKPAADYVRLAIDSGDSNPSTLALERQISVAGVR